MPKTITEGFNELLKKLTPNVTESKAAKDHRESIRKCLVANYKMKNFFRTGSTGNSTSISGFSDTDYFASIPAANLWKDSSYTLRMIKETLATRFPLTGVHVDNPAVVCPFGSLNIESTEIVPACHIKKVGGFNIYEMPDGNGGWMKASPLAHNNYVAQVNKKHGFKVKPLIRFIKAWKYYNNVPISSFYIEIRVTKYAEKEDFIDYPQDILRVLRMFESNTLSKVIDPTGISGYIEPCSSLAKKIEALSKVKTGISRAEKAVSAQGKSDIKNAFEWWNKFYNNKFPSYYKYEQSN
jgi:hypothetical protein